MRRRQLLAWAAAFGAGPLRAQPAPSDQAPPLSIVLAPFLSPAALLTVYRPLREHLERQLQRPVQMFTAKDFRTLAEETRRGEHGVVQLPAHLARLAMLDWDCELLAAPALPVTVVVAVKDVKGVQDAKSGGPVRSAADLRGARVGMLDALSLTATVGRRWLEVQGIAAEVQVLHMASVNSAMFALDRGEIAAVVAADTQLVTLPPGTPRGERVLASIGDIPGPLLMAGPDLPPDERAALRAALQAFMPDPAMAPSAANAKQGPLTEPQLKALDPYAAIARQALG
jgi:ABC-type phosphate/phosphonate transport system substrate-binding protein